MFNAFQRTGERKSGDKANDGELAEHLSICTSNTKISKQL